ncbi:MAG: SPX domain-containing protein [Benjaminiella poitrasii]|nr:MAG: SPX domain-containing protein [Benjaminiella poitrasii]
MKFAKYLESESIPEWRKAYINYKGLKKRLKAIEKVKYLNTPFYLTAMKKRLSLWQLIFFSFFLYKYRKLNQNDATYDRYHSVINDLVDYRDDDDRPNSILPISKPSGFSPSPPVRTQSSILDNRSSGLQPRNLSSQSLFRRFSFRFGKNQDSTELDRVNRPSIPFQMLQTISVFEEAVRHASKPEQYFFVMLDQDLETISRFYDGIYR